MEAHQGDMKTTESDLAPTGSAGLSRWLYIARLRWKEACRSYPNELGQIKVRLAYAVVLWGFVAAAGMAWGFDAPHVLWPMVVVAAGTAVATASSRAAVKPLFSMGASLTWRQRSPDVGRGGRRLGQARPCHARLPPASRFRPVIAQM